MSQPLINEVLLDCDATRAFDLLADVRNESRLNERVSRAELRSDGPVGEGSTFVTVYMGQENQVTLREFDRPLRVVVAAGNAMMDIDTTYEFSGTDAGTRMVVTTDVRPRGPAGVLSPLLRVFLRRELAKEYATVAEVCRSEPSHSCSIPASGR